MGKPQNPKFLGEAKKISVHKFQNSILHSNNLLSAIPDSPVQLFLCSFDPVSQQNSLTLFLPTASPRIW